MPKGQNHDLLTDQTASVRPRSVPLCPSVLSLCPAPLSCPTVLPHLIGLCGPTGFLCYLKKYLYCISNISLRYLHYICFMVVLAFSSFSSLLSCYLVEVIVQLLEWISGLFYLIPLMWFLCGFMWFLYGVDTIVCHVFHNSISQ